MKTRITLTKNNEEVININEVTGMKMESTKVLIKTNYRIYSIDYSEYDKMEVTYYE